jgi:hypothetical protein
MSEKEIRKLKKAELIELYEEKCRQVEEMKAKLDAAQKELDQRRLECAENGNLAETAKSLSALFEETQKKADAYLAEQNQTDFSA